MVLRYAIKGNGMYGIFAKMRQAGKTIPGSERTAAMRAAKAHPAYRPSYKTQAEADAALRAIGDPRLEVSEFIYAF